MLDILSLVVAKDLVEKFKRKVVAEGGSLVADLIMRRRGAKIESDKRVKP